MIKYLVFTLLLSAFAVNAESPNKPPRLDFEELVSQLNIDQNQAAELREIMEKHRINREQNREQNRESRRQMHEANKEEIAAILTAEQMEIFDEYMKEHRPKKKRRSRD
ncbi:MAG: hypothetical protein GY829_04955 [Gammaproteobacteria bacterium]|nr:hypothetical protein [Gammaproteobacteria bacterium]